MSHGRRVLLVSPVFHGYWRSIARGLEANDHTVEVCCYDEHVSLVDKARNKLVYEGLDRIRPGAGTEWFVRAATAEALMALRATAPEVVVVVKGDLLGDPFWEALDRTGVPRVVWLYDEVRRTLFGPERLARLGVIASYSPGDVAALRATGVQAHHLPLAFDPSCAGSRIPSDDVVFIGARYPGRTRVLTELQGAGVSVLAVGNDWSHRVVDRLRTWDHRRPPVPARPSVARAVGAGLMAGARATLNIHGDQDGFTMRTFEASGVGALQLIDRDDVAMHYEPGEQILTFETVDQIVDHLEWARRDPAGARRIRSAARRRTLAEHTFAHRAAELERLWS